MTVVDKKNYGVEDLVYFYLKNYPYSQIENILGDLFGLELKIMHESVSKVCRNYNHILFPNNINDPRTNSQTSWFDLKSKSDFAINVKYGFESSANSRIRDLTLFAVNGINEFFLKHEILDESIILSYEEVRNQRFNRISNQIKLFERPRPDRLDILYLKYTYLFCMNFIEGKFKVDNIFFIKFTKNGDCSLFQTKFFDKVFLHKSFVNDLELRFSKNTKDDPHKQTVKYFLKGISIGFLELRSNKRVMLHLRHNQDHWTNLLSIIENYYE